MGGKISRVRVGTGGEVLVLHKNKRHRISDVYLAGAEGLEDCARCINK